MPLTSLLAPLVAALAVCSSLVAAAPAAPPKFEVIFSGVLQLGDFRTTQGPFGTRINGVFAGNLTDPSGKLVATALPSVDFGVVSTSGIFFPDAVLPIIWEVDGKLASLRATGVGKLFERDLSYVHLETESESWSELNGRFLVADVTFPGDHSTAPVLTLFGVV